VDTACLYVVDCAQRLTKATLNRRIAAISRRHRDAGHTSPTEEGTFRQVMAGVRRRRTEPQVAKRPLRAADLFEILAQLDDGTAQGLRDRALLVVGFTGALRRSELVALDVENVRWTREGMVLNIRVSKTDQEGKGIEVGIPNGRKPGTCPVRLLKGWLEFAEVKSGPIFRPIGKGGNIGTSRLGDRSVALIVKRTVGHAGFSPEEFSGHSLRAGLATSAAEAGQQERDIMQQTRHKSEKMVRRYIRKGSLFQGNVVDALGF
jgi:integrase